MGDLRTRAPAIPPVQADTKTWVAGLALLDHGRTSPSSVTAQRRDAV